MRRIDIAFCLAGIVAAAGIARACIGGTPWEPFSNRKEMLATAPANSFAWEAAHLVPPGTLRPPEPQPSGSDDPASRREAAEHLPPAQTAIVTAMRAVQTGHAALAFAGDLPPAIRLYTAGAVDFAHDDLAAASAFFAELQQLPPALAASRAVWASYMLGRIAARQNDAPKAESAFAACRQEAAGGAPDPLGLAVASFGDQARLLLDRNDIPGAVALYAAQAAAGSDEAVQSLRIVAERIAAHPDDLPRFMADPLTQRLLIVHALAQTGDYLNALHAGGTESDMPLTGFPPTEDSGLVPLRRLGALLAASPAPGPGADRLAALLYAVGDYAQAEKLARIAPGPMAIWVRAKIAAQRGDMGRSAALYAAALHDSASQIASSVLSESSRTVLRGETGTLALTRGDFRQALETLWPVASVYWGDVAYLAERVLDTDALMEFVAAHVPPAAIPAARTGFWDHANTGASLRALLARRLMREGKYDDALRYFDPVAKDQTDLAAIARDFIAAQSRARAAFWAAGRAQAGWRAATILRQHGMDIMGTELNPDQAALNGEFEGGFGPDRRGPASQPGYFTPAEQTRFEASAPKPDLRFHYRYLAVDAALHAAKAVPARSQAYAAMLCHAAHWMDTTGEPDRAQAIYRTYRLHGAVVPFASHFGYDCPAPDFGKLSETRRRVVTAAVRNTVHRWKFPGGAALLAAAAGTAVIVRQRRSPRV